MINKSQETFEPIEKQSKIEIIFLPTLSETHNEG